MQKKLIVLASSFCVMAHLCFAQENVKPSTNGKVKSTKAKPTKAEVPKIPELDPKAWDFLPEVVATAGKIKITKTDLVKVLTPQAKMMIMMGQKLADDDYKNLAKGLIQELIKAKIVENLATKAGYRTTPEMEDQIYNKFTEGMKKQMADSGSKDFNFEEMVKQQGLTVADVKKQMAEGEVIQKWINEKIIPKIKISDSEVKAFYDKNKENLFKKPETVTASHILFKPKDTSEKSLAETKALAEKVYKEIVENKSTFEADAKKYSEGPSKENGGQLGTFAKGQMVPEFEAACWKLAITDMKGYELVKTQFGWHIIKVTAFDKGGYVPLDKTLSSQIREKFKQEGVFKKINKMIDNQMKLNKPEVFLKDSNTTTKKEDQKK